jgi:predicted nucleic acid-binding protein
VILLDTCILVDLEKYILDLSEEYRVSILSRAEFEFGIRKANTPQQSAERIVKLADLDSTYNWLIFDEASSRAYGEIAAGASATGAKIRSKDALIAAQAYQIGAAVMTENVADFAPFAKYIQIVPPKRK